MFRLITMFITYMFLSGCASSYVTPGGNVNLRNVKDIDIKQIYELKPTAKFPAHIAFIRIQQSGYRSHSDQGYGSGSFSIITNKLVESEKDIERIKQLNGVAGIAPLSKIVIPKNITGLRDLRLAAAKLHADILLVYTFDTTFKVGPRKFEAMDIISLGFLENKEVKVTTTASAAFYDAKTGYLYGLTEVTESKSQMSDLWNSSSIVDKLRKETESTAFTSLIPEIENTWYAIINQYKYKSNVK